MIIGSIAIKYHFEDFPRKPKDIDLIIDQINISSESLRTNKKVEQLKNPVLLQWFKEKQGTIPYYCNVDELYTLKISHLFWDVNWEKHMWDVQFLKNKGCEFIPELFYKLYDYWNIVHGKNKRSDLQMTSEEFFDNVVTCPYDHDKLHTILKEIPTFNKVLKDGEEVDVSEEKFNLLSYEEKKSLVQEEVMIMSFERQFHSDYRHSYNRMLKKFIISHAPLWEATWIIENYLDLQKAPFNYFKLIKEKINEKPEYYIKSSK